MIFDRLAAIVEQHFADTGWFEILNSAKLFHFSTDLSDLPRNNTPVQRRFTGESFFLPYQAVALVDSMSCTLFADPEPNLHGPDVNRDFLVCFSNDRVFQDMNVEVPRVFQNTYTVIGGLFGALSWPADGPAPSIRAKALAFFVIREDNTIKDGFTGPHLDRFMAKHERTLYHRIVFGVRGIVLANSPEHFIVESTPINAHKPDLGALRKIIRSSDRPHYTLLKPDDIARQLGVKRLVVEGEQRGEIDYRRAHPRFLASERFTTMRNQWIIVRAVWRHPTEWMSENGRVRYRMILDK